MDESMESQASATSPTSPRDFRVGENVRAAQTIKVNGSVVAINNDEAVIEQVFTFSSAAPMVLVKFKHRRDGKQVAVKISPDLLKKCLPLGSNKQLEEAVHELQNRQVALEMELDALKKGTHLEKMRRDMEIELREFREVMSKRFEEEQRDFQRELTRMRQKALSKDDLAKFEVTRTEFQELKKKIYDRGLLAPKPPPPVEPEAPPPVGELELTEDVFTARLLIRLGFMKGKMAEKDESDDARDVALIRSGDTDGEDDEGPFSNVHGIEVPDIEEGGEGYAQITSVWLFICLFTQCLQVLILLIMIKHGYETEACLDTPLVAWTSSQWWVMRLSKAFGLAIAGVLTGMEVMHTMNYLMTSQLLEPRFSWEVHISAILRLGLCFVYMIATIAVFMTVTNPGDVWMNATALGFVYTLSSDMLDVAKAGMFGHHIAKSITSLNFTLTFVTEYPKWFDTIRWVCQVLVSIVIVLMTVYVFFFKEEPICGAEEYFPIATTTRRARFFMR